MPATRQLVMTVNSFYMNKFAPNSVNTYKPDRVLLGDNMKTRNLTLIISLAFCIAAFGQNKGKEGILAWNFDVGYMWGDYKIGEIDKGEYKNIIFGTQIGLNLKRLFLGYEIRAGSPMFTSVNDNLDNNIDRTDNPLPERQYIGHGPAARLKFGDIHLFYNYYFSNLKYKDPVSDVDSRSLYYKYEGIGQRAGIAGRLFGNTFIAYSYQIEKYDEFQQKIDGVYTELKERAVEFETEAHMVSLIFPINFTIFEILADAYLK